MTNILSVNNDHHHRENCLTDGNFFIGTELHTECIDSAAGYIRMGLIGGVSGKYSKYTALHWFGMFGLSFFVCLIVLEDNNQEETQIKRQFHRLSFKTISPLPYKKRLAKEM